MSQSDIEQDPTVEETPTETVDAADGPVDDAVIEELNRSRNLSRNRNRILSPWPRKSPTDSPQAVQCGSGQWATLPKFGGR